MLAQYLEIPGTVPRDIGAADAAVSGDRVAAAEKAVPGDKGAADAAAATPLALIHK
jgi:hypothetical protein